MWHELRVFVTTVGVSLSVAYTVMNNTVHPRIVRGESMQPVLNPAIDQAEWIKERKSRSSFPFELRSRNSSDVVLVNKWIMKKFDLKRGDIVILVSPLDPEDVLIKRLIAFEGDTVKPLPQSSKMDKTILIPKGYCWVEGDHHARSLDSNSFGPIPLGLIIAKATHIIWPIHRWCRLQSKYPEERVIGPLVSIFGNQ